MLFYAETIIQHLLYQQRALCTKPSAADRWAVRSHRFDIQQGGFFMEEKSVKKKFTMPNTFVVISIFIMIATVLTWIIPSGTFDLSLIHI